MATPEFNRVDLFIQNSLPKAPNHYDDVEKGMWTLVEFAKNMPEPKTKKLSGWQKNSLLKKNEDMLLPIEVTRIQNYVKGLTNKELPLPDAIDYCLQTFRSTNPLSIDRPFPSRYSASINLASHIPDRESDTEKEGCENAFGHKFAQIASQILTKKEFTVLTLVQQGLNTVEIGKIVGCVRQYVPQIEREAKSKLFQNPEFLRFMDR